MRFALAVLVLMSTMFATGCADQSISETVAIALAKSDGGTIISTTQRAVPGLGSKAWYIIICRANEIEFVEIYGSSNEPKVSRSTTSIGVCGEGKAFWEAYEKALQVGYKKQPVLDAMDRLREAINN